MGIALHPVCVAAVSLGAERLNDRPLAHIPNPRGCCRTGKRPRPVGETETFPEDLNAQGVLTHAIACSLVLAPLIFRDLPFVAPSRRTYDGLWGIISSEERAVWRQPISRHLPDRVFQHEDILPVLVARLCLAVLGSDRGSVYFAGLMLFGQEGGNDLHLGTGCFRWPGCCSWRFPLARAGARTVVLGVVLSVITFSAHHHIRPRRITCDSRPSPGQRSADICTVRADDSPANSARRASLGEIDRPTREPDNYLIGP